MVHLANHTQPSSNKEYSDDTFSILEEHMSSAFEGASAPVSRGWQPGPQIEPFHQSQSLISPRLPLSPSPQLEPFDGAQPPMPAIFFPSLVPEDSFGSTYRTHPTRSGPRGASISRQSLVAPGRFNGLRGLNRDRISLRHSDPFRRLQGARNRLFPLPPIRTCLSLRRQDSRNYATRAALDSFGDRPVFFPEAESWASQQVRHRSASTPRQNTPLQPSGQAAGPDSKLGREILDEYDASQYSRNETTDLGETPSLANNEAELSDLQSNVDIQDPGSPFPPFSGIPMPRAAELPADVDVEQLNPRRSPSPDSEILTFSPVELAGDFEGAYFQNFPCIGEDIALPLHSYPGADVDEPYSPRSPDLATASLSFLPDWEPEESHRQESNDVFAHPHYRAGLDTTLWDQPLAFSRAPNRVLSDGPSITAGHYTQPGFAHEFISNGALGDTPLHESNDFSIRDRGNIINQNSRTTAGQTNGFQCSSAMSHQVQFSEPFGENAHLDEDEISDDESEGTVVGDRVEIDGVWNRVGHSEADSMIW